MKTAKKTSANRNVEKQEFHFHFNWNPTSDSASLKEWEAENAEYATWNLIDDEKETVCCYSTHNQYGISMRHHKLNF